MPISGVTDELWFRIIITFLVDVAIIRATILRMRNLRRQIRARDDQRDDEAQMRVLSAEDRLGRVGIKWIILVILHYLILIRFTVHDAMARDEVRDASVIVITLCLLSLMVLDEYYARRMRVENTRQEVRDLKKKASSDEEALSA